MLRFTIITCTWNSGAFLQESIDSVLAQDYREFEYIFVDGGSTDDTLERIRAIDRPYRLVTGVRGGISRAMNEGLRLATGDVVAHLHSDDYYAHPGVLREVATALERSGAGWAFGRTLLREGQSVRSPGWVMPRYSRARLLKGNFIAHPSTFVRRRLFEQVGEFDVTRKYAMDYDMWLRLARVADPVQIDSDLAVFRMHAGSVSSANELAGFEEDFRVRLAHASRAPWWRTYHWAHYLVRRRRLRKAVHAS